MAKWKLYWVTSRNDDRKNGFIIARNARSAATFHERSEGMNQGDAHAERVGEIPSAHETVATERFREWSRRHAPEQADEPDLHPWPSYAYEDDLNAAGAECRTAQGVEEVILNGRSFAPSTLKALLKR